jgi:hypothetical protein
MKPAHLMATLSLCASAALGQSVAGQSPSVARYRLLSASNNGVGFLDELSVKRDGEQREYRLLAVFEKPGAAQNGVASRYGKILYRLDCKAWTYRNLSAAAYAANGDYQSEGSLDATAQPIAPGTPAETVANYLCKDQLDPAFAKAPLLTEKEAVQISLRSFQQEQPEGTKH